MGRVYLLFVTPALRFKIGKTENLNRRVSEIETSLNKGRKRKQKVKVILALFTMDEDEREDWVKVIFKPFLYTWRGSGKTEYIRFFVVPFVFIFYLLIQFFDLLAIALIVVLLLLLFLAPLIFSLLIT